ncbi:HAD family hydrolase [Micromonospora sp. CA-263727]|uniref:HAD family hydrolase n=1 Tax=Micromonospora sp. CA-263727 TaxID=3239967 RepID=UPI003D933441
MSTVSVRREWNTGRVLATPKRPLLILWDIDHTLIETRGLGRELYARAFEEATGSPLARPAEVTGRTELAIFAESLRRHGIEPSAELTQRYAAALSRQYRENVDGLRERGRALPGAAEALALFAEQPGLLQSVLTGNLRQVAITKLHAFDLAQHIDIEIGAYGDDHLDRPRLVPIAQKRAAAKSGQVFDRTNTVLIGDSTQDVSAGQDGGAAVVGIASGADDTDAMRRAGAVAIFRSLTDPTALISAIAQLHA